MLFNLDLNRFTEGRSAKRRKRGKQAANCPGSLISWAPILVIFKFLFDLGLNVEVGLLKFIQFLPSPLSGTNASLKENYFYIQNTNENAFFIIIYLFE